MTVNFIGSPNYSTGRAQPITKIVCHWMAGSLASTDATFRNVASEVSAHYGIEDTIVHQYVKESDTAWHAARANPFSVGIEHSAQPGRNASESTYHASIELCAEICQHYGLNPDTDIEPHSKYVNTQCPGTLDLNRIKAGVKQLLKGGDMPNEGDVHNAYLDANNRRATANEVKDYTTKAWDAEDGLYKGKVRVDFKNLVEKVKSLEAQLRTNVTCTPDERQLLDLIKKIK